jgi:hypothetical protein
MSVFRRNILQAKDSLQQSSNIVENLVKDEPNLQELKNAAKMATQAAETLNRLVGMRMTIPNSSK